MSGEVAGESEGFKSVDRFGFYNHDCERKPIYDLKKENERLQKWMEMLRNWDFYVKSKPEVIKRRIRKGIPEALRGRVWSILLSADVCSDIYGNYYEKLVENHVADEDSDFTRKGGVIDRDINRTFPLHESFAEQNGLGQEVLRNVLNAFADRDKEIKYTQGMNYLVGLFLTYMSEEETFWALRQLMENAPYMMSMWFNQDLTMVHTCGYQMEKLLDKYLPTVGNYLREICITPTLYTPEWFMCIYSRSFPFDVVVRIWDIFLAEGWVIVYQVALALLKLNESRREGLMRFGIGSCLERIVGQEFEVVYSLISNINTSADLPSADEIINTALSFRITPEELETLRKEFARSKMKKVDLI